MPLTKKKTNASIYEVIGPPTELSDTKLPTHLSVVRYFNLVLAEKKIEMQGKNPPVNDISTVVCERLLKIWERASIPTVSSLRIKQMIFKEHKSVQDLNKSYIAHKRNSSPKLKERLDAYMESGKKLFDIASCKCTDYATCKCPVKIPDLEKEFLADQRTEREMYMEGIDTKATRTLKRRAARRELDQRSLEKRKKQEASTSSAASSVGAVTEDCMSEEDTAELPEDCEQDVQFNPHPRDRPATSGQARIRLETFSRACERRGVSNRGAAQLASSLIADLDRTRPEGDKIGIVFDKNKVQRERKKTRRAIQEQQLPEGSQLLSLYFDGRKDQTKVLEQSETGKLHPRIQLQEHISLIREPGSAYLGHVTPERGDAESIAREIWSFFMTSGVNLSALTCIGSDGEAKNTGKHKGIIRRLEEYVRRPLQWVICQLHSNELPLRHLLEHIDGKTSGPNSFQGNVGKSLLTCETRPVVAFEPIDSYIPLVDKKDLSRDRAYLLDVCLAVVSSDCSADLANSLPGPIDHARWLTTACRIIREYMASENPSEVLQMLAEFVVKVYAPMWFHIKQHSKIVDAPRNLWLTIEKMKYLPHDIKNVLLPALQKNAFWAHPENILVAILADERPAVRQRAASLIIVAREQDETSRTKTVRKLFPPQLNFDSEDYTEMISWESTDWTEPPITRMLSTGDLQRVKAGDDTALDAVQVFFNLPCHNQAVERCVKEVTRASSTVCGPDARDGFIRARLLDREIMPSFETKAEFKAD